MVVVAQQVGPTTVPMRHVNGPGVLPLVGGPARSLTTGVADSTEESSDDVSGPTAGTLLSTDGEQVSAGSDGSGSAGLGVGCVVAVCGESAGIDMSGIVLVPGMAGIDGCAIVVAGGGVVMGAAGAVEAGGWAAGAAAVAVSVGVIPMPDA